jgi:hypothetical protein
MSDGGSPVTSRRVFAPLILAVACLATAAPHAQTPAAAQAAPTLEGYPAVGSPSIVKVIDAGAQPRKTLRYNIPATFKGSMDMTMEMSMNINAGGMPIPPMAIPAMKMSADLAVTGVTPAGDTSYTMAFTGVTMDSAGGDANPLLAQLLPTLQNSLSSIKGTATVTNRGQVKETKIDMGQAGAAQQMMGDLSSQLDNLSTPLPEEAVGVGAKWEARSAMKTGGQVSFQKVTAEVVAIAGNAVTLKLTIEQTLPAQTVTNSALPAGIDAQMDGGKGSGTGTMVIHLDSLIPTGETAMTSSMSMTLSMGGQSQPMTSENTIKMKIDVKK